MLRAMVPVATMALFVSHVATGIVVKTSRYTES
jgi:hypothetical protein